MRALLMCLQAWLDSDRKSGNAYLLLRALVQETLKRVDSPEPDQRQFDAEQLVAAVGGTGIEDYERAKEWVRRARLDTFCHQNLGPLQSHFQAAGHSEYLLPELISSGGRHRVLWWLKRQALPGSESAGEASVVLSRPEGPEVSESGRLTLKYEFTPPGQVKPAWFARPLVGCGSVAAFSWRMWLWLLPLLFPIFYMLMALGESLLYLNVRRPLETADLAGLLVAWAEGWFAWHYLLRPVFILGEDRILPASDFWLQGHESPAQWQLARGENKRVFLQLVRYRAVCPLCTGEVELRYSQGPNRRRLVGCCREAPHEHVFSFDRTSRRGRWLA